MSGDATALGQKKIPILFVILSLEIGGMEQVVSDLIRTLDRKKFEPIVACLESLGPIGEELQKDGFQVRVLFPMVPVVSFLYPAQLTKIIRDQQIDVVHVHSGCWHKAAMAGFLTGVKRIIYTEHGRPSPDVPLLMRLDKLYSFITTHVVCVSQNLADYMIREVGISSSKISCIINGINETKLACARTPQKDVANRIGIIARLAPVKDIPTLLQAVKLMDNQGIEFSLTVAGDGPERENLELLAASLGIASKVSFLGFRRDIAAVLAEIDIFVLSSVSEGTSITLLEAMAAGKSVVVTNVGGNPALVKDGINGFLVPSGDPAAMADALSRLMFDRSLRERMSSANIQTMQQQYSIHSMTKAYESLYGAP
jgi:glycosyltransferase involved in cell wall biosynthesis